jgi:hypothetical protein
MQQMAGDSNGQVHRHIGSGLLGRLLYARDAVAVLEIIESWKKSGSEALRFQALRFYLSPAGNDPDSGAEAGLRQLAQDESPKVKHAAQLALEKRGI